MSEQPWRPWQPAGGTTTPGLERVIGHRGAAARAPENTLAGLRTAHRLGCRWVEFDVMLSRDEVPVLIHDERVDRTTGGRGAVPELTFEELCRLDAGARFFPRGAPEPIPRLDEAVALCAELGLAANVEIKPARGHERRTAERTAETLQACWPATLPLLISSFERPSLAVARDLAPAMPRGLLAEALPPDWETALLEFGCTTLNLDHNRVTVEELSVLAARGVPVLFYTVNSPERAGALLAGGASAVFTDVPDIILGSL